MTQTQPSPTEPEVQPAPEQGDVTRLLIAVLKDYSRFTEQTDSLRVVPGDVQAAYLRLHPEAKVFNGQLLAADVRQLAETMEQQARG